MIPADQIRSLLAEAYELAKQSHSRCYDDYDTGLLTDKRAVMRYAAACISKYAAAAAIYWEHPELEDGKFIKLIGQFDRVTLEAKKFYASKNNATGFCIELQYLEDMLRGE